MFEAALEELETTQTELEITKADLVNIKAKLTNTKTELADTKASLSRVKDDILTIAGRLENDQAEPKATQEIFVPGPRNPRPAKKKRTMTHSKMNPFDHTLSFADGIEDLEFVLREEAEKTAENEVVGKYILKLKEPKKILDE